MSFKCEFCGNIFNRQCNLITHKKTAKYCLEQRGIFALPRECIGCNRTFSKKFNLKRHQEACAPYFKHLADERSSQFQEMKREKDAEIQKIQEDRDVEVNKLKSSIKILEEEVSKLKLLLAEGKGKISVYKERPGVVNNQYINPKLLQIRCDTIPPLTIENVKKEVGAGKYTYERFIRGEAGLVDFISTLISDEDQQRSYVCTDTARNKFHRLIETREWENDNGATFLNKILDQLKEPATKYYQQILDMTANPTEDRELGEILMTKTKPVALGITCPKSKDRNALFNRIRTEVRKLASV